MKTSSFAFMIFAVMGILTVYQLFVDGITTLSSAAIGATALIYSNYVYLMLRESIDTSEKRPPE